MIKLTHILPTNMINPEMVRQDYEMYLTDEILKNKEKFAFLADDKELGIHSYKILDNSAFELGEGLTMEKVLEAAKIIGADEIILPDIVNSTESFSTTIKALEQIDLDKNRYRLAAVVQGDNFSSRSKCLEQLMSIKAIKTIMIPKINDDRAFFVDKVVALRNIYDRKDVEIHLLGLRNEGLTELMFETIKKNVRSVDTGYFMAISNEHWKGLDIVDPRPRELVINVNNMFVNDKMFKERREQVDKVLKM